jgi:hypothetical protein
MFGLSKLMDKAPAEKPMGEMSFGPNFVSWDVRRARWIDKERGIPLTDSDGNVLYEEKTEHYENHNLTCYTAWSGTKDRMFNSATTVAVANYIVLSADGGAPASTDTLVASEITQSGLARATAAYYTTACGTGECILQKVFTATANVTGVVKMGLLDAAAAGNLYFEATIVSCTLVTNDTLTAQWNKITVSGT